MAHLLKTKLMGWKHWTKRNTANSKKIPHCMIIVYTDCEIEFKGNSNEAIGTTSAQYNSNRTCLNHIVTVIYH